MQKGKVEAILVSLVLFLASCESLSPVLCTTDLIAGIEIEVIDEATNAPAAFGAVGIVRDGNYTDTLRLELRGSFPAVLSGADERAGNYTVTVTKAGYKPFSVSGVEVTRNECQVNTVFLRAALERE